MTLLDLGIGQVAIVEKIAMEPWGEALVSRLEAMGILPDKPIRILRKGWWGGALHVRVGSTTEVIMRRREASFITVTMH